MTNYVITSGTADKLYQTHDPAWVVLEKLVDFSKFTGTAAGAAADTADVITLPAGFIVENVLAIVVTPSTTSSSTFGVGDSSSSTGYLPNTTSATATAGTAASASGSYLYTTFATTPAVTALTAAGKYYGTADTLRVVLGTTAPLDGVVKFVVRGAQVL